MSNHSRESFLKRVSKLQQGRHPFTGEKLQLKTTMSQEEKPRESLTAFTVSEIMQGSATFRPDEHTYDAFNQSLSTDLGHLIDTEGGISGTLGTRAPLLAYDISQGKRSVDDGIFTAQSGIAGAGMIAAGAGTNTANNIESGVVGVTTGQMTNDGPGFFDTVNGLRFTGKIARRSDWGARVPKSRVEIKVSEGIFVHHTVTATGGGSVAQEMDQMKGIQSFHMDGKGWADIAYSWLVGQSGTIYEGRGWGVQGGHTENWNSRSHAVCFIGNSNNDVPTQAALKAINAVIEEHHKKYGPGFVKKHAEVSGTECPGNHIKAWIDGGRRIT